MGMLELIKLSLWNNADLNMSVSEEDYDDMKMHAILALPAKHLSHLGLSPQLKAKWRDDILQQMSFYTKNADAQYNLPVTVPYTVLKGSTAAQYYPCPEYRTMGDIDIITHMEDFDTAYQQLLEGGYQVIKEERREIAFGKDGVVVELHRQFAALNNIEQSKFLDDLIIENINPTHILPDLVNGLVLLEHISQHLEYGLGLRQIIDWMMFADKCIEGEKWDQYLDLTDKIGLKTLTVTVAGICETYLGYKPRNFIVDKDDELCRQLMSYILSNGDFGCKLTADADTSIKIFSNVKTPKMAFRLLQEQGLLNWKAANKYKALRAFAWLYQLCRYISRGLKRERAITKIREEYSAGKKWNAMFDRLGIKRAAKGIAIYKDGKYVKK